MPRLAIIAASQDRRTALAIDPGYNTVDWFVCQGMSPSRAYNNGIERGMGGVMRAIAEDMDLTRHMQDAVASLAVCLAADESVRTGQPVRLT